MLDYGVSCLSPSSCPFFAKKKNISTSLAEIPEVFRHLAPVENDLLQTDDLPQPFGADEPTSRARAMAELGMSRGIDVTWAI